MGLPLDRGPGSGGGGGGSHFKQGKLSQKRISGSGTDEGGGGAGGGGGTQSAWDIAPPWGVVDTNDYIKGLQDGFSSSLLQQIRDNFTTPISDADLQSEIDLWNEAGMDYGGDGFELGDGGGGGGIDIATVSGMQNMQVSHQDIGISSGAVGSRKELGRMLESYQGRRSLIQAAQRQKAIYTIDRFDGGLNLNKSPRDLAYWEACQMDELTPSKVGRLIRLGDFTDSTAYEGLVSDSTAGIENYGLHYFKLSNESDLTSSGVPTNYIAFNDGDDIDIWDLTSGDAKVKTDVISSLDTSAQPVYHHADNRLYVSDANLKNVVDGSVATAAEKSRVAGIIDRPRLYPYSSGSSVSYNMTSNTATVWFIDGELYHPNPTAGIGDGHICVSKSATGLTHIDGGTGGIYINAQFANIVGDESSGTGWGAVNPDDSATPSAGSKFYKIYASFLYDNGSETKLTDVTSTDNSTFGGNEISEAKTTSTGVYQKLVIKQVKIDGTQMRAAATARIHGARFYYTEVDYTSKQPIGDDKYLFAELDFRYGLKLVSEFGNWNLFENDTTSLTAIQVANASESSNTTPEGTLQIISPPTAFTYYSLNLFHQEELKEDLMWKASTMGNGIAFIGNIKYDNRYYPDTMLYSGAGETDAGSAYPMWGTFPVDSNRIDIPGAAGEITALKWTSNRVLQFRKNALYVVNVEDVLAPRVEGVYQGMGVHGQYAVTETPFGVAWVNENGAYAYNSEEKKARSLTIGRLDTEGFIADSTSKIGYDDRAKMLIVGNYAKRANALNYAYAYSFVTDAWCTWSVNRGSYTPVSNFAIDHDGYLTGGTQSNNDLTIYKWSAEAQEDAAVDYITKDIDFGKPILDKRMYTLYISYTGGANNAVKVYFRANGKDGALLGADTIWYELKTLQDYTDPYGSTGGDDNVSISTTASLDSEIEPSGVSAAINNQRLAKINLRSFATDTTNIALNSSSHGLPPDYFRWIRSIQLRFKGIAADTFEINDISLVFKEKRIK